jgi:microcystin-dependent protein
MQYVSPLNEPENSPYTDGNAAQGIEGSIVPAAALEHPQREITGLIMKAGLTPDNQDLGQLYKAMRKICAPSGQIMVWAGTGAPDGFLLCNGQEISRTTYADLFAAIGIAHGAGDGATSFTLPDLRDRFVLGASANKPAADIGGSFTQSGRTDGHALTIDQMPRHDHEEALGKHAPFFGLSNIIHSWRFAIQRVSVPLSLTGQRGGDQPHDHTITDFDVTNPYYALAYIIRT